MSKSFAKYLRGLAKHGQEMEYRKHKKEIYQSLKAQASLGFSSTYILLPNHIYTVEYEDKLYTELRSQGLQVTQAGAGNGFMKIEVKWDNL